MPQQILNLSLNIKEQIFTKILSISSCFCQSNNVTGAEEMHGTLKIFLQVRS